MSWAILSSKSNQKELTVNKSYPYLLMSNLGNIYTIIYAFQLEVALKFHGYLLKLSSLIKISKKWIQKRLKR